MNRSRTPPLRTALNSSFVSIKVDREERPDVDAVYMEAVQAITGSGGWPMSVFLTPDRRPFFGGTYFPPEDRRGMPSFRTVLGALADVWDEPARRGGGTGRRAGERHGRALGPAGDARGELPLRPIGDAGRRRRAPRSAGPAVEELSLRFDPEWGGFGAAPKFPQPDLVDLVLLHSVRNRGEPAGDRSERMATVTLDAMAAGGIHDHLGGGFARYSTDDRWLVPHFEKMLYDQAGLLRAFLHGWQATGRANYRWAMDGIVGYVSRDLTGPEGGVCSAEDADSEGVEGRFYVWTPDQLRRAVAEGRDSTPPPIVDEMATAAVDWFGVTGAGNFEGDSILHRPVGQPLVGPPAVEAARSLLFEARESRVRPGLDDKVITEWNAMYASALAEAAGATGNAGWADAAVAIGEFLCAHLLAEDGRWRRSWQPGGGGRHLAFAADYAWLVDCFTRLGELTGEARVDGQGGGGRRRAADPVRG